ncbi:hypothetical protein RJ639_038725 [Escallonia herrerae]|uniref:Non-haem dioxygenase N-terminal domain-containing protein n=1 Tax=Escallonia herrerae TaxID=1293975 RepID=A0AA88X0Q9_9ASTE|nr:hypothetical protein RJ639_038725 [Escallonia herrerae]
MEVASRPIRVQSIAQSGTAPQVPPEYIQPPETRPNNPTARPANNPIPSIDLSSAVRNAVFLRTEIGATCREWGAFHVTNHSVPPKLLDKIRRMGHTFFKACPMEEKLWYSCDTSGAATEGYDSLSRIYDGEDVTDFSADQFERESTTDAESKGVDYDRSGKSLLARKLKSEYLPFKWLQLVVASGRRSCQWSRVVTWWI